MAGDRTLCCRAHLESPRVSVLLPVTSPTHHNRPWPEEGHSLLSSMEGCSVCMVCNPQTNHPLPVAGSCTLVLDLGTWRQRSRQSSDCRDIWEEAKDTLCASLFYANVSVIENINKSCYVWMASSKFHFVCICIPKWELGLSWASFSFSESFGNTPCHSMQISHTWFKSVRLKSVQHRKGNGRHKNFIQQLAQGWKNPWMITNPHPNTPRNHASPWCCWSWRNVSAVEIRLY